MKIFKFFKHQVIFFLLAGFSLSPLYSSTAFSAPAPCPSDWICYDPAKSTHDQVAAAISELFKTRGYQVSQTAGVSMQNQGGRWVQVPSQGIEFIRTNWQPPTDGTKGAKWLYEASFMPPGQDAHAISLMVMVQAPPTQLLGVTVEEAVSFWHPPDMSAIREEIQKRLQ